MSSDLPEQPPQVTGGDVPPVEERVRLALASIDRSGLGLEIGPSYNPLISKRSGARIETLDHATREQLIAKYQAEGVPAEKIDQIEEVDYVSTGGSLVDAIGRRSVYDYILASNLVEHTVDLIGFLQDCEALLKPEGRLSLIVPDQRFCFDLLKPFTSIAEVVDAHLYPSKFHPPGTLLQDQTYSCTRGGVIAWGLGAEGPVELRYADTGGYQDLMRQGLGQAEYVDVHRWRFTPSSFALLVQDLRELGYHSLAMVDSSPTLGFEFFVTLGRREAPAHYDRLELLQEIRREFALVSEVDALGPVAVQLEAALTEANRSIAALEETISAASRLAALHEEALASLRRELDGVLSSRSWRMTAPVRRISGMLKSRRSA